MFKLPKSVLTTLEVRDELAVLNPYHGLQVQPPHDGREIQIMYFAELPGTQSVIALISGSMMSGAKGYGRGIGRLLPEAVGAGMGRFNPASGYTNQAGLGSDPGEVSGIPNRFHDSVTSPPHLCSQCRQKAQ